MRNSVCTNTKNLNMKRNTIIEIIAILFMILFLYTGISKLVDYPIFKAQLEESPVMAPFSTVIAWGVPLLEIGLAILLLLPAFRLKGLYGSLFLMSAFTIYVIALVSVSDKLPCSCGGVIEQLSWQQHIIFNSAFTGLAAWAVWLQRKSDKTNKIKNTSVSKNASVAY